MAQKRINYKKLIIREIKTKKKVHEIDVSGKPDYIVELVLAGAHRNTDTDKYYIQEETMKQKLPAVRKRVKIVKPSDLPWPDDWDISIIGLSQSLICAWKTCKRKFLFSILGYYQPSKEEKTNFGNICHEVNDRVYSKSKYPTNKEIISAIDSYCEVRVKDGSAVSQQQIEFDAAKAEATLIPYFEYYKKDFEQKRFFGAESKFCNKYNGATLRGKIDLKYMTKKKKKWLKEHKTKGQISEDGLLLYLPLDFQNRFYILNDEIDTGKRAEGVLYNVIRNTKSAPLKNESLRHYKKKIMEQCRKNPEHFYKRWESAYTEDDMYIFGIDLDYLLDEIKFKTNLHVYPNTWMCLNPWRCEFLKACSTDSCSSLCRREGTIEKRLFPELQEDDATKRLHDHLRKGVYRKLGLSKEEDDNGSNKSVSEKKTVAKRIKKKS
jgi:hypothetical protein